MPDPSPFPRTEFLERLRRTKLQMEKRGVEVLLVTDGSAIVYLTGYTGESSYVPQLLLVQADVEEPTLYLRPMDVSGVLHTGFLAADHVIGYPESYVGNPDRSPFDFMIDAIVGMRLNGKRLGLDFGAVSGTTLGRFQKAFPDGRIVDVGNLVDWVRIVKSAAEVALIRQSAAICDAAVARAAEVVRPGVRECDAVAEVTAALIRGTPEHGAHRVVNPLMPSGTKTGTAHLTWTDTPYRAGTSVNVELGAFRYRYAAAIMRTISLGRPSDRLQRLHDSTVEGLEAALTAARPGATCGAVAEAFGKVSARNGFPKESRCGYPIGIDWLEPSASLRVGDRTELVPNMTFHLMLGMWVATDFGLVFSETFRITENGSESLSKTPRRLIVVE
jgi:Xaa-Pro aminopeptidase